MAATLPANAISQQATIRCANEKNDKLPFYPPPE